MNTYQTPEMQAFSDLNEKLEAILPDDLFDSLIDAQRGIVERLKLQVEINEFLTSKLIKQSI